MSEKGRRLQDSEEVASDAASEVEQQCIEIDRLKNELREANGKIMADEMLLDEKREMLAMIDTEGAALDSDLWLSMRDARDAALKEVDREKDARIYYQDIVCYVCNILDRTEGRRILAGEGIVCGTPETPATEVQDAMMRLARNAPPN